MKTINISTIIFIFLVLSPEITNLAGAQAPGGPTPPNYEAYATPTPAIAIIIVVLVAALFLTGFFSVYARHCYESSDEGGGNGVRSSISTRRRGRGLDAYVMETFPTFTYSEVKHHKIGKDALECSVCLNEFEDDEKLKLIPKCDHVFHPECIDVWLGSHVTCPVCRADLVPKPGDDPIRFPNSGNVGTNEGLGSDVVERGGSRNEEVRVEMDGSEPQRQEPSRPPRSWSVKKFASVGKFSFKFKSHSTGHSLAQPVENLERFTLRLPEQVRKDIMDHQATLNRTRSCAATLPRERSTRRGGGGGEGRFYQRINQMSEGGEKSEKWAFFTRTLSLKLPKVVAETGQESTGKGAPVKMPSFNCLEPKVVDEMGLFSDGKSPV